MSRSEKSFLHIARERRGLSQESVASKFGVTQATISNWERGVSPPHPNIWDDIAATYGVSIARLFAHFKEARAS